MPSATHSQHYKASPAPYQLYNQLITLFTSMYMHVYISCVDTYLPTHPSPTPQTSTPKPFTTFTLHRTAPHRDSTARR